MSSLNLNKAVLAGHLTADPELKQTPSGVSVCSFTVAINRRVAKDKPAATDFVSVVAWRERAEFIARYFRKGSALCILGAIQTRSWKDAQGSTRYATEVVAEEAMFVDGKKESGEADAHYTDAPSAIDVVSVPHFADDPDVPF